MPAGALALLCIRELVARRDALRARLPELGVYAAIGVGLLAMIGAESYLSDAVVHKAGVRRATLSAAAAAARWAPA